jgi:hypothetical protein
VTEEVTLCQSWYALDRPLSKAACWTLSPWFNYKNRIQGRSVLASLPSIHIGVGPRPIRYGPVWYTPELVPPAESEVRLTILGLQLEFV